MFVLTTQVSLTLTLCCRHLNSWLAHGRLPVPAFTVFEPVGQEVVAAETVRGVELVVDLQQDLVGVVGAGHVALPDVAGDVGQRNVVVDDLHRHRIEAIRRRSTPVTPLQTNACPVAGSTGQRAARR